MWSRWMPNCHSLYCVPFASRRSFHVCAVACLFKHSLPLCECLIGGIFYFYFFSYVGGKFMVQHKVGVLLFPLSLAMAFHPHPSHPHPLHVALNSKRGKLWRLGGIFVTRRLMFVLHIFFRFYKYLCLLRLISSILTTVFCRLRRHWKSAYLSLPKPDRVSHER